MRSSLAFLLLLAAGCAEPPAAAGSASVVSEQGLVDVQVQFDAPVVRGDNQLLVILTGRSSRGEAQLLAVDASMAAHAHQAHAASIEAGANGFEVDGLNLFMTGRWQLELQLAIGNELDRASLPVDVP